MSPAEFAARLNGREYGDEITNEEAQEARAAGLVVVYGYSDDNVELDGAILNEVSASNGTEVRISPRHGLIPSWESVDRDDEEDSRSYHDMVRGGFQTITAEWAPSDEPMLSWRFKTDIPHATFEVMEDGDVFCRGIVFRLGDVTRGAS
jgi:hypothetical protein